MTRFPSTLCDAVVLVSQSEQKANKHKSTDISSKSKFTFESWGQRKNKDCENPKDSRAFILARRGTRFTCSYAVCDVNSLQLKDHRARVFDIQLIIYR